MASEMQAKMPGYLRRDGAIMGHKWSIHGMGLEPRGHIQVISLPMIQALFNCLMAHLWMTGLGTIILYFV